MFKTTNYINQNDGIIAFINNSIINTQVTDLNTNFMSSLEINCKKGNSNFTIYGIYRPPQIDINSFLDEFEQTILHRARTKKSNYTLIKGDLNIDIINNSLDSNNYLNLINEYGFTSLVNCITRTKEIGGSCLDHVLIKSNTLTNVKTFVAHTSITDHYSIVTNISNLVFNRNNPPNPKIVKQVDYLKLSSLLKNYDWSFVVNDSNVNSAANKFIKTLKHEENNCSLEKKISSKTKKN